MKILMLTAENIKKLVAVEITPVADVVEITGKNGQGKTSVLDSIWWALAGATHIQAKPIRKGQTKARVRLNLGEIIVERKFTEGGNPAGTLVVESVDGARYPSPQRMLDSLIGELSFDPLAFSRMDPRKQFDELRSIAKLDVDLEALDTANRTDYARRTELNRAIKENKVRAAAIVVPEDLPAEKIDESALLDQLQAAGEKNADIEKRKGRRADTAQRIVECKQVAEELRQKAKDTIAAAESVEQQAVDFQAKLDAAEPLPEPVDLSTIREQLRQAHAINDQIDKRFNRSEIEAQAADYEKAALAATEAMAAREKQKADAIMAAQLPVEGLGFGDGVVTYNGVPFEQASSAEQLRVSLSIAMAANPKLRVIRIQDGSLLDDDSMAQIAEMAKANEYQVWIERVDTTGKVGIVIEDGMVAGAPVPAEAEA
jgi:chemotaxis protein histidine kinase CheA